jgi:hypothetical protein
VKNYSYERNEDGTAYILEKNTRHIIKDDLVLDVARSLCKKLNGGFGFNGWTPSFFLN